MLSAQGCQQRRRALWAALPEPKPNLLIIVDPLHVNYLANFWVSPFSFRGQNAAAALLLAADGRCRLVADNLLEPFAAQAHVDELVAPTWYDGTGTPEERGSVLIDAIVAAGRAMLRSGKSWASELDHLPAEAARQLGTPPTADLGPILQRLRYTKGEDELKLLRRSAQASAAGLAAARDGLRPGMTELDLFHLVQQAVQEFLGEPTPIYGDFVSGPRTAAGGGGPTRRRLEAGDLVLVDFSPIVRGYRADVCSTWRLADDFDAEQQRLARACQEALAAGIDALRPGRPASAVHQALVQAFRRLGLADFFPHHAGHGVGLAHPEAPFLTPASDNDLAPGMVVTLEPGLYLPKRFGLRLEHNFLITADGCERLTRHEPLPPPVPSFSA